MDADDDPTLLDLFRRYVTDPDLGTAIEYIHGAARTLVSPGGLLEASRRVANALTAAGVGKGDRVVISISRGDQFSYAFWGCQILGAIAVPVAPLDNAGRLAHQATHVAQVCDVARPRAIVLQSDVPGAAAAIARDGTVVLTADACLAAEAAAPPVVGRTPDDIAFLQFTSGSTSAPKGCALSNRAAAANAMCVNTRLGAKRGDSNVHWIPLHHDMGLMGGVLSPVQAGMASVLMSPKQFMFRPLAWIEAMAGRRGVHSAVSNFAFVMVTPRAERLALAPDSLAGVSNICCGAEPIDADVVRAFFEALAPFGLSPSAFHACYGMAETTVLATSAPGGLRTNHDLPESFFTQPDLQAEVVGRPVVSQGRAVPFAETRIVGEDGAEAVDGRVGEVQLRSRSLFSGYYNDPEATTAKFDGQWFRTGDLGFAVDGEVFVTGRKSDIIIIGGKNIYPRDVELAVAAAVELDPRKVAVFGAPAAHGAEALVLVIECRPGADTGLLARRAEKACIAECGSAPVDVLCCANGAIPKTTSGKIRRLELRATYLAGGLRTLEKSDSDAADAAAEVAHG